MRTRPDHYRFGIAEWYGRSFVSLTPDERKEYAGNELRKQPTKRACPFLSIEGQVTCWKKGGVCSLRSYQQSPDGTVSLDERGSSIRTTCPSRFEQEGLIYSWIAEVLLDDQTAVPIGQVKFLERVPLINTNEEIPEAKEDVGRIDNVLVVPNSKPLQWCPVEIQSVYFSGMRMSLDFELIKKLRSSGLPFPAATRRPDYRSSGPKRLMPQLQVKVPTLRRWGKKMAIVVDEDFFGAMGQMKPSNDLSNADVAWFVVRYADVGNAIELRRGHVFLTVLEEAVSGLIAGVPVSQHKFEDKIRAKLAERTPGQPT
jgi:hypothetical protein